MSESFINKDAIPLYLSTSLYNHTGSTKAKSYKNESYYVKYSL